VPKDGETDVPKDGEKETAASEILAIIGSVSLCRQWPDRSSLNVTFLFREGSLYHAQDHENIPPQSAGARRPGTLDRIRKEATLVLGAQLCLGATLRHNSATSSDKSDDISRQLLIGTRLSD
jgi:hypothetical protein